MRILSRDELGNAIVAGGVPMTTWLCSGESVVGLRFRAVTRAWVDQVYNAWLDALQQNAPHLVEIRQLPGGRSRRVPRYFLNGFSCRGQGLQMYAHGMMGLALQAADTALEYDALAFGFLHYSALPRLDNLNRNGRHQNLWWIDEADGSFQTYEQGDGEENEFEVPELSSVTFLYAQ